MYSYAWSKIKLIDCPTALKQSNHAFLNISHNIAMLIVISFFCSHPHHRRIRRSIWLSRKTDELRLPPTRGKLLVFVRFCPPVRAGGGGCWTPPLIHVTLISTRPFFQFIWCSTYWIQVLIPRLHWFFRKFRKIFGSLRPSLTFFRQIRTLSPWYLPNRFFNSFCVQHTGCKY